MSEQINTSEEIVSKTKEAIIKEAKRIEESCKYTAKGHFVAAQFWSRFHLWIGIPMTIISAVAGTSAFGKFDNHEIWAGVCSIIVAALAALVTFLNPNEKSNSHLRSGNSYDSLQSRSRIFWTVDVHQEASEKVMTSLLKDLSERRDKLNGSSPQVSTWAYLIAKKGIAAGEADFEVDKAK